MSFVEYFDLQIAYWGVFNFWLIIVGLISYLVLSSYFLVTLYRAYKQDKEREERRERLYWLSHDKHGNTYHNWDINY